MVLKLLFTVSTAFSDGSNLDYQLTPEQLTQFNQLNRQIFKPYCSFCHSFTAKNLIEYQLIEPGNSNNSLLYLRMTGSIEPKMPLNSVLNPDPEIEKQMLEQVRAWIDSLTPH